MHPEPATFGGRTEEPHLARAPLLKKIGPLGRSRERFFVADPLRSRPIAERPLEFRKETWKRSVHGGILGQHARRSKECAEEPNGKLMPPSAPSASEWSPRHRAANGSGSRGLIHSGLVVQSGVERSPATRLSSCAFVSGSRWTSRSPWRLRSDGRCWLNDCSEKMESGMENPSAPDSICFFQSHCADGHIVLILRLSDGLTCRRATST